MPYIESRTRPDEAEDIESGGIIGLLTISCRHIALIAAMIATCGSLFFSEVLKWLPCELCWYQRIFMYPLTAILAVGILKRDPKLHWYVLPLSLTGSVVSTYHYLEVMKIISGSPCTGLVPCSVDYLTPILTGPLSFIKIPFLALFAFMTINVMMANFALAGDEAMPRPGRGQTWANRWMVGIVVVPVLVTLVLADLM